MDKNKMQNNNEGGEMKKWLLVLCIGLLVCSFFAGCGTTEVVTQKPVTETVETEPVKIDDTKDVMLSVTGRLSTLMECYSEAADLISEQLGLGYDPASVAAAATPVFQEFITQVDKCIVEVNACTPTDAVWIEQVEYAKMYLAKNREAGLECIEGLRLMGLGDYDNATACINRSADRLREGTALTEEATRKLQ